MYSITEIGVVDTNSRKQVDYAIKVLDEKLYEENAIAYELIKIDHVEIIQDILDHINKLINQIMTLKELT